MGTSDSLSISIGSTVDVDTALPTDSAIRPLTRDLLAWLARTTRTYAETMEAWRSTCPRLTIWEDALADGLVRVESGNGAVRRETVVLTPRGRAALAGA